MSCAEDNGADGALTDLLLDLDSVIADPLKFKRKLRIGHDAYAMLRMKTRLQSLWEVGGFAATGATAAASPLVASTFFSGGLLSMLGIGAAATPIGWVIAAAALSGGAYYGVTRLVQRRTDALVDTIPRFISTPIDLLGMQLFDLVGALALRVAEIDGEVSPEERDTIQQHFTEEWGYDPAYVARALEILQAGGDSSRVRDIARTLSEFTAANPDCNAEAMQAELLGFLREVMQADGVLDEREELAIEAVASLFREQRRLSLRGLNRSLAGAAGDGVAALKGASGVAVGSLKGVAGAAAGSLKHVRGAAAGARKVMGGDALNKRFAGLRAPKADN